MDQLENIFTELNRKCDGSSY